MDPKDCLLPLQKAYFDALDGVLSCPVLDAVGDDAVKPYATLGPFTAVDRPTKLDFGFDATGTVQVWTSFPKNTGGMATGMLIIDEIIGIIRSRDNRLTMEGFDIITTIVEFQDQIKEDTETETLYRALIRFRHSLIQIT